MSEIKLTQKEKNNPLNNKEPEKDFPLILYIPITIILTSIFIIVPFLFYKDFKVLTTEIVGKKILTNFKTLINSFEKKDSKKFCETIYNMDSKILKLSLNRIEKNYCLTNNIDLHNERTYKKIAYKLYLTMSNKPIIFMFYVLKIVLYMQYIIFYISFITGSYNATINSFIFTIFTLVLLGINYLIITWL